MLAIRARYIKFFLVLSRIGLWIPRVPKQRLDRVVADLKDSLKPLDREILHSLTNRSSFGRFFTQSAVFHMSFRDCATSHYFGTLYDIAEVWITIDRYAKTNGQSDGRLDPLLYQPPRTTNHMQGLALICLASLTTSLFHSLFIS